MHHSVPRLLLTWSDRGGRWRRQPGTVDVGPIIRLLQHADAPYAAARVLGIGDGGTRSAELMADMRPRVERLSMVPLDVADPSDHEQLFVAMGPAIRDIKLLLQNFCPR